MNVKTTAEKMKTAMEKNSFSELAEELDITLATIDSWKRRNTIPNKYLLKVSEKTGVSLDWLLSEDKPTFHISGGSKNISQVNGGVGIQESNKNNVKDIDEATLSLFKEAYTKAKENDKINHLRLYLMEFK